MAADEPGDALLLAYALEELRRVHGRPAGPSAAAGDGETDSFRAFRARLLRAAARAARAPAELSMWWEGTFNGYALVVQVRPARAIPDLPEAAARCGAPEWMRLATPRDDGYPLAHVEPGRWTLTRSEDGTLFEAPFGSATGHHGAPGMRRTS